ncbi:MAG: CDP-diacylglycerol--serine O-phosphatidyltransferase [Pseudomonadota bacterium]
MAGPRDIREKGAFLLPNALTTGALFAGVYSIMSGINGDYAAAAVAIGIAGLLDGLDGRVARLTNTQSEFGVQYDSLSDMISFGLAPAILAFNWSLQSLGDLSPMAGKLGWLAAFVYIACAALRLARFNAQAGGDERSHFQGLASPAAAVTLAAVIWFFEDNGVAGSSVAWLIWLVTLAVGLLMFSNVRYFSFKTVATNEKVPITWLFGFALALVLFAVDPPIVVMVIGIIYISSGVIYTLNGRRKRQARRALRRRMRRQAAEQRRGTQTSQGVATDAEASASTGSGSDSGAGQGTGSGNSNGGGNGADTGTSSGTSYGTSKSTGAARERTTDARVDE